MTPANDVRPEREGKPVDHGDLVARAAAEPPRTLLWEETPAAAGLGGVEQVELGPETIPPQVRGWLVSLLSSSSTAPRVGGRGKTVEEHLKKRERPVYLNDQEWRTFRNCGGSPFLRAILRACKQNEAALAQGRLDLARRVVAEAEQALESANDQRLIENEAFWTDLDHQFNWRVWSKPESKLGGWLSGATGRKFLAKHGASPEEAVAVFRQRVPRPKPRDRHGF